MTMFMRALRADPKGAELSSLFLFFKKEDRDDDADVRVERGPGRLGSGRAYKDDKLAFVMGPMRAFERRFVRRGGD